MTPSTPRCACIGAVSERLPVPEARVQDEPAARRIGIGQPHAKRLRTVRQWRGELMADVHDHGASGS